MNLMRNKELRDSLIEGQLMPITFAKMDAREMASKEEREKRAKMEKDALDARRSDWAKVHMKPSGDSLIECIKCKSFKTTYTLAQTRGADEPMTAYFY